MNRIHLNSNNEPGSSLGHWLSPTAIVMLLSALLVGCGGSDTAVVATDDAMQAYIAENPDALIPQPINSEGADDLTGN